MKQLLKFAVAALAAVAAVLGTYAQPSALTYQQAVQLVKTQRLAESLDCDSVNFYAAVTDTIINNYCCTIEGAIPEQWDNQSSKILVFVNENPRQCWNHPCSYYYLPSTVTNLNNVPIIRFEGVMPPSRVSLTAVDVNVTQSVRAIGNLNLMHNPIVPPSLTAPNVSAGSQHQVLIMAAGINDPDAFTTRWNECASLYRVLTQIYNVPKNNIHIFMGLYDSENLMVDNNADTVPMLRDLDGDGIIESIQSFSYGALDDFRDYVADSLAQTGIGHLFAFYTGGLSGYDPYDFMNYYIPMMTEDLDVMDFEATVSRCHADYNTIFGCCKDANYIASRFYDYTNTISIVANYYSYYADFGVNTGDPHEYYRHWIAAIAAQNLDTGSFVDADYDNDGYVTMLEANSHASAMQTGNTSYMRANPSSVSEQVSFGRIELYKGLHIESDGWESPDIWVRNQNDGLEEQEQDILTYDPSSPYKYLYVRVSNNCSEAYNGSGVFVNLYWKKPVIGMSNAALFNSSGLLDMRGHITTIPLNCSISSQQDTILTYQWALPSELVSFAQSHNNVLPVVIMAELTRTPVPSVPKETAATNGLLRLNVHSGNIVQYQTGSGLNVRFKLYYSNKIPVYYCPAPYGVQVSSADFSGSTRVYTRDRLWLELSSGVNSATVTEGGIVQNQQNTSLFRINGPGSISGLSQFNALDSMIMTVENDATQLPVGVSSDKIRFRATTENQLSSLPNDYYPIEFIINGYDPLGPIIQAQNSDDDAIVLFAQQIGQNTDCTWYNASGKIGAGNSLSLCGDDARGIVQLIAIDHENGRAGSAVIDLDETITGINARFINGGQDVMLELARPITHDLTVNCVSVMTGQTVASGVIPAGSENLQLPSSSWPCGTYVLAAIKNGTVVGTVQLLKQ